MENYEQKYKEALERARDLHDNHPLGQPQTWSTCEKIFPELKESEDEKIRKEIIQFLQLPHPQFVGKRNYEEWIAWLEKQKGNKTDYNPYKATVESIAEMCKSYSTSTDLHDFYDNVKIKCKDAMEYNKIWLEKQGEQKSALNEYDLAMIDNLVTDETCPLDSEYLSWLKSIKDRVHPKQELSEEDEKIINDAIWLIEHYVTDGHKKLLREQTIDKLKSLKPNHWKPSEEQMEALVRCLYEDIHQDKELYAKIESLYNELKNL